MTALSRRRDNFFLNMPTDVRRCVKPLARSLLTAMFSLLTAMLFSSLWSSAMREASGGIVTYSNAFQLAVVIKAQRSTGRWPTAPEGSRVIQQGSLAGCISSRDPRRLPIILNEKTTGGPM